ncbi:iron-containing alcohol dehydrogenase, partial [Methylobacterium sp. A54F]
RVLLVTDRGVRGAGLTRAAEAGFAAAGIGVTVFEDVVADPPAAVVERAAALARSEGVEAVVSVGGGSALDTAKLVALLARSDERLDDLYGVGLVRG